MTTNFDRAAAFYDDTRRLPEAAIEAFTDRLAEALGRAKSVLEVGVGTGRVAVPLSNCGYTMTGIDVSEKMLAVLEAKSSAVKTQLGDATDLPFDNASFDAVLAVDVFHLVSDWRSAVDEAVRVLRPGGRIVVSTFVTLNDPTIALQQRMFQEAGVQPRRVGIEITDVMAELEERFSAKSTELTAIPYVMDTSLMAELDGLRAGIWSRFWGLPEDLRHQVADKVEGELRASGADLDESLKINMSLRVLMASRIGQRINE